MKVMAANGQGVVPIPTVVAKEAVARYALRIVGVTDRCRDQFYAITAERRITHPLVSLLTESARKLTFA